MVNPIHRPVPSSSRSDPRCFRWLRFFHTAGRWLQNFIEFQHTLVYKGWWPAAASCTNRSNLVQTVAVSVKAPGSAPLTAQYMAGVEELPAAARNLNIANHVEQQALIRAHPAYQSYSELFWKVKEVKEVKEPMNPDCPDCTWRAVNEFSFKLHQHLALYASICTIVRHSCDSPVKHRSETETLLRDTHMEHSILALQTHSMQTLLRPSQRKLFWDTLVGRSCSTLFEDTLLRQSCCGHYCKARTQNPLLKMKHAKHLAGHSS